MKMMDINGQDDCCIEAVTPVKKKKMKQVQLSFQTQSSVQSQNVVQSKKRKLTSPSVNYRSPKAVKISNKKSNKSIAVDKLNDNAIDVVKDSEEFIEIDVETENVKENTTYNKVESIGKNKTPKRSSTGQKKIEKKDKVKSSPLTKFLKKTDKEEESLKESHQTSSQDEKDKSINKSSDIKTGTNISQSAGNLSNEMEDIPSVAGNSLGHDSDSDIVIMSSDNEDTEEHTKSNKNIQEDTNTGSPRILKTSKIDKVKFSSPSPSLDSDIVMQSLDTEGKEEQSKSNENMEESIESDSSSIHRTPKIDKAKQTRITPKQQEKKLQSAKKKEERERIKMEKEKRLEEERQNRQREKEEKRRGKEEKEKAEKEQKMMEKKMKDLKKQMEMEQKQKEKQAKEEERRKRDEEKKKKEEEKLEAERKKQKAASNFTSFFVAKKQEKSVEEESTTEVKNFMPFEVKADMKLAPVCRRTLNEEEKLSLDKICDEGNTQTPNLYLSEIKSKTVIPRKSTRTWTYETKDDIIILDDENDGISNIVKQKIDIEKQRTKLLQFSENRRPPYWGTWRKQSRSINSRKPFAMDTKWFNYEVDSDDEWEEEEPGESLHGSDDERDEENPDDNEYDVDNEFMVPHGYLSDEELRADEEEKVDMTPETQKFKLKVLGEQFETEMNTKTSKLKPKIIGCIWRGPGNTFLGNVPQRTIDFLSAREVWVRKIPAMLPLTIENDAGSECNLSTSQQGGSTSKKTRVPEEALPALIRLIHGNTHSRKFLAREFMSYWSKKNKDSRVSKSSLLQKIREIGQWIACPEEGPMHLKVCWYVPENVRKMYLSEDLPLPNRWSYTLELKNKDVAEVAEKLEKDEKKNVPLITQFTKKITQQEMKRQLAVKPTHSTPQIKFGQTKAPKRATLISVGRGEQFSKASKMSLMTNFVSNDKTVNKDSRKNINDGIDDNIVITNESLENEQAEDKRISEEDEPDDKKESKGRIGVVPMECDSERKEQSPMNTKQVKNNDETLKSKVHAEDAKETVVTLMDIDSDNPTVEK